MLEKAKARRLHHRLEHADLPEFVRGENSSSYDLVLAADVLVHLGRHDDLMRDVKRFLRPGGIFGFSVEAFGVYGGACSHAGGLSRRPIEANRTLCAFARLPDQARGGKINSTSVT